MRIFIVLFSAMLFTGSFATATELRTFGQNLRNLGMGGVRAFDGSQASVQLWNPAGIAFSNGVRWDVINFGAGINGKEAYDLSQSVSGVHGIEDMGAFYGKPIWVGATGSTSMMFPLFGISLYDDLSTDFMLNNPVLPELKVKYYNDVGVLLGTALRAGDVSFGVNVKQVNRLGGDKLIGADLLADIDQEVIGQQFQDGGIGYGLDFGLMYKADVLLNPMVSLSYQDVGITSFQKTRGLQAPSPIKDNLTLGANISADAYIAGFTLGAEYRHINTTGEPLGKKVHLGAEINLLNMDFRAGLYQGYPTFGVGLDLYILQVDAALFTIERGAYPGQTPEQRMQVGISSSFGFDPDFKLLDFGGKKRRLKQRR